MCQVWLLPDTQDGQCPQIFHSFMVYVKGASLFGPKYAFLVILGQISAFSALFVPCPTKKQGAQVVVPKLLFSPVKIRICAQKRPNLTQNWHFWSIRARPCRLIWCSVGGLVGGFGARAVSRKTPIYFIYYMSYIIQSKVW